MSKQVSFDRQRRFYKLCLELCTLLLFIGEHVKGVVEIFPPVVAPVCQVRSQLELTCTTSGAFNVQLQQWQLIADPESGTTTPLQQVSSAGSTGVSSDTLMINSVTFAASRLSDQGSSPLISRMIVNPVSEGLNGSEVNCVDTLASESARTTILIIGDTPPAKPNILPHSEPEFLSDRVVVDLEWTVSNPLGRYQHLLIPNVTINVVPDAGVVDIGDMSIQLTLPYNTLYNVSVTQSGICGQPNQTAFTELNYTKCYNPGPVLTADLIIEGYEDPALEGENITFSCNDGFTLIGPNSATCMENGEWEPDPREANCTGLGGFTELVTSEASTITLSTCSSPLYVLQIKDPSVNSSVNGSQKLELNKTHLCCYGFLIAKLNMTTCLENGEWELETFQMKHERISDPTTSMLRTALISVTCLSIMVSALTFVIGFVCGHYFSHRWKTSATGDQNKGNVSNITNERGEDLELKENVAYITLQPK